MSHRNRLIWHVACCLVLACFAVGCGRGLTSKHPPIHVWPDMDSQGKYKAQSTNAFFYDRMTMQAPVPGTVALGELEEDLGLYAGKDVGGDFVVANPIEVTDALLARGAGRYGIYCAPCHRPSGDGEGILFQRGSVPTTSLHDLRIRTMLDGELFTAITDGVGLMPGYAYPLSAEDRWAVVAHVRALQKGE